MRSARRPKLIQPKESPCITVSEPFPLLDPGQYVAYCTDATFDWSRQWKKWIAILTLEPLDYRGRPHRGRLCKFFGLGKDPQKPHAGSQSHFRRLLVEVNGDQPSGLSADVSILVGLLYDIEVETVITDREGNTRPPEFHYSVVREIHLHKQSSRANRPTLQHSTRQPSNTHNLATPQPSNTPTPITHPRQERASHVRANVKGVGNRKPEQQHDYPEGRAGYRPALPGNAGDSDDDIPF